MAFVIHPAGNVHEITPTDVTRGFTLNELYSAIGCDLVERVWASDDGMLIVDEEGLLKQLPYNHMASVITRDHIALVGVAVYCSDGEFQ